MPSNFRHFTLRGATGTPRTETFDGREYLVVPVTALVEGVIQALNSAGPEFVPASLLAEAPVGWNGRPVFLSHPLNASGVPISGNTPDWLETSIGKIFNTKYANRALKMEAWLDIAKAKEQGGESEKLLERVKTEVVEVSVGAAVAVDDVPGVFKGAAYVCQWESLVPDHLALLPTGATGACSAQMGCGVRAASASYQLTERGLEPIAHEENHPMSKPAEAEGAKPPQNKGFRDRVMEFLGLAAPSDMSDTDVRTEIMDALRAKEPSIASNGDIIAVYPTQFIYALWESFSYGSGPCYYRRDYSIDDKGEVTVADTRVKVEKVTSYEPEEPEDEMTAAMRKIVALSGKRHSATDTGMLQQVHDLSAKLGADCAGMKAAQNPCGCGKKPVAASTSTAEGDSMKTKTERVAALAAHPHTAVKSLAALNACTDEELTALEAQAEQATVRAAAAAPAPAVAAAPKTLSEKEWMDAAPESIRTVLKSAQDAEAKKKADLVAGIKAAQNVYSEDELTKMSVPELEKIAALASVEVNDYSGRGLPRGASAPESTVAEPPAAWASIMKGAGK